MRIVVCRVAVRLALVLLCLNSSVALRPAAAAGVTLITHGLNGNVNGWVTGMANQVPLHHKFAGTNSVTYLLSFVNNGNGYSLSASRLTGTPPTGLDSGEIIIKLDWSQLADGNSYNTFQVAAAVVPALLSTNFFPDMAGHAVAELPLHLVGHSRGGSLICEMSRLLGTNGLWVDHLTTLDPHPLNNDGFFDFIYSQVDAPARTYSNVLFHDNYWQDLNIVAYGEPVAGAYARQLQNLNGGYSGFTASHSDVHLWYHGTITGVTPTGDTEANISITERQAWWTPYEQKGTNAGFIYSLIGGGNRLSTDRPEGTGYPAILEGYNQWWDFGAGTTNNRTALSTNNGSWPNLLKLNRTGTNALTAGQEVSLQLYYQWARPSNTLATAGIYLDDDQNPFNTNQTLLRQISLPGTTAGGVSQGIFNALLSPTNAAPGSHYLFASIQAGGQKRYLYAPERVQVIGNDPPTLDIAQIGPSLFRIGVNGSRGQNIILQASSNLVTWESLATNILSGSRWLYTNAPPADTTARFYRSFVAN